MSKIILGVLLLAISSVIYSQDLVITGKVLDEEGEPMPMVSVCQHVVNCDFTDTKGNFRLELEPEAHPTIVFSSSRYQSKVIRNVNVNSSPLIVHMIADSGYFYEEVEETANIYRSGIIMSLEIGIVPTDFNDFNPLLKEYNVSLMNRHDIIKNLELALIHKGLYAGISAGFTWLSDYDHDSLEIEFNATQYGLHLGYALINSRKVLIIPEIAANWNKYRLINREKDHKIPIEQYISARDLDIRFNQLTAYTGMSFSFKMYHEVFSSYDYWTVGFYAGYCFKLTDKPWIRSRWTRLTSDSEIKIDNYNIGIQFTLNMD